MRALAFRNNWIASSFQSCWRSHPAPHVVSLLLQTCSRFLLRLVFHLGQYGWREMTHTASLHKRLIPQCDREADLCTLLIHQNPNPFGKYRVVPFIKPPKFVVVSRNTQTRRCITDKAGLNCVSPFILSTFQRLINRMRGLRECGKLTESEGRAREPVPVL